MEGKKKTLKDDEDDDDNGKDETEEEEEVEEKVEEEAEDVKNMHREDKRLEQNRNRCKLMNIEIETPTLTPTHTPGDSLFQPVTEMVSKWGLESVFSIRLSY